MQRNCIFPGRYAPLTYYEDVLKVSRNTLMARNAREIIYVNVLSSRPAANKNWTDSWNILRFPYKVL